MIIMIIVVIVLVIVIVILVMIVIIGADGTLRKSPDKWLRWSVRTLDRYRDT